jgi:hypothetical protein
MYGVASVLALYAARTPMRESSATPALRLTLLIPPASATFNMGRNRSHGVLGEVGGSRIAGYLPSVLGVLGLSCSCTTYTVPSRKGNVVTIHYCRFILALVAQFFIPCLCRFPSLIGKGVGI